MMAMSIFVMSIYSSVCIAIQHTEVLNVLYYVLMGIAVLAITIWIVRSVLRRDNLDISQHAANHRQVSILKECLESQRKRCILYKEMSDIPVTIGCSKTGGVADLPVGRQYPHNDKGEPMELIVQLRCSDLEPVDTECKYPHSGMLYFFDNLVLYCEQTDSLCSCVNSTEWNGVSITFERCWDFPSFIDAKKQVAGSRWVDYNEAYQQLRGTDGHGQLGGYYHPHSEVLPEYSDLVERSEVLLSVYSWYAESVDYLIEPKLLEYRSFCNTLCIWN